MKKTGEIDSIWAKRLLIEQLESRVLMSAMVLDVRQLGTAFGAGKSIAVQENGTFTLGIYLRHIEGAAAISADANNGLGHFTVSLRSYGEATNGGATAWPVSPTPTDTVVNAQSSANMVSQTSFDVGFSNGVVEDLPDSTLLGPHIDSDTDNDLSAMSASQADGGAPYQLGIAIGNDVLLGTVTYKALALSGSTRPLNRTVDVNAYYTNSFGSFGGAIIRGLINHNTDDSNQISQSNLIVSQSEIGAPVVVTVGNTTGTISGRVFNDLNANGIFDGSDTGISGFRVFLDQDSDGVLDPGEISKPVSATGTYTFSDVPAGTYRVREVFRSGWRQTFPALGYYQVPLRAGDAAKSLSFANTDTVLIKGMVFMDANKDGKLTSGEPGLGSWTLYLDANNNGILDSGETNALSDANGNYRFFNIPAGTYVVRAVQQSKFKQTAPSGGTHTITLATAGTTSNQNFGEKRL